MIAHASPPNSTVTEPSGRWARLLLGVVVPALTALAGLMPPLLWRNQLPDPLATHFTLAGAPDGTMRLGTFVTVIAIVIAIAWVCLAAVAAASLSLETYTASMLAYLGGFLAGMGVGPAATLTIAQWNLTRWQEASLPWWLGVATVAPALLLGGAGARLADHLPTKPKRLDRGDTPTLALELGERALWTQRLHSSVFAVSGLGISLVAVIAGMLYNRWLIVPGLAVGGVLSVFSSVRVRADRTGLRVGYGLLPWPSTVVSIDRIRRAEVLDVHPAQWGGWGYRGSLRLMRRAAVVLRAGPGIHLELQDGREFVVTVDHPETGVALLNAEVQRQAAPR